MHRELGIQLRRWWLLSLALFALACQPADITNPPAGDNDPGAGDRPAAGDDDSPAGDDDPLAGDNLVTDTDPPALSDPSPTGALPAGTTSTGIAITSDEPADCRFDVVDAEIDLLALTFTSTGGTRHEATVDGLADGQAYTYYVRCRDNAANANPASTTIVFSVATPFDPLVLHWPKDFVAVARLTQTEICSPGFLKRYTALSAKASSFASAIRPFRALPDNGVYVNCGFRRLNGLHAL